MSIELETLERSTHLSLKDTARYLSLKLNEKIDESTAKKYIKLEEIPILVNLTICAWPLRQFIEDDFLAQGYSHEDIVNAKNLSPTLGKIAEIYKTEKLSGLYAIFFKEDEEWYIKDIDGGKTYVPYNEKALSTKFFNSNTEHNPSIPKDESWLLPREDLDKTIEKRRQKNNDDDRIKNSNSQLLVIGALLRIIKSGTNKRHNQSSIITEITEDEVFSKMHGLSKRNLEKIFGEANKKITDEQKK